MSTETPATHLARIRVQFGYHYRIEPVRDRGRGWVFLGLFWLGGTGSLLAILPAWLASACSLGTSALSSQSSLGSLPVCISQATSTRRSS